MGTGAGLRVLVAEKLAEGGVEALAEHFTVESGVGWSRDELLAIRTWPPRKGIYGPRWHEAYRPAADGKALVFGHDAPGGLVRRHRADGTPYLVGLDTGCVYGGELTAWILEEDRIVQVAGQKAIETGPPVASG